MITVDANFDILYNCDSQFRKNHPTIDCKKHLWLHSIDNFILKNRHNGELHTFEIPDSSKFVMATKSLTLV